MQNPFLAKFCYLELEFGGGQQKAHPMNDYDDSYSKTELLVLQCGIFTLVSSHAIIKRKNPGIQNEFLKDVLTNRHPALL